MMLDLLSLLVGFAAGIVVGLCVCYERWLNWDEKKVVKLTSDNDVVLIWRGKSTK